MTRKTTRKPWLLALPMLSAVSGGYAATQQPAAPAVAAPPRYDNQYDLSGNWIPIIHEDGNNRQTGGVFEIHAGLPLNDAARARHEAYSEDETALLELQCRRFITPYSTRTAHAILHITADVAPAGDLRTQTSTEIVAYHLNYQHNGTLIGGVRTFYLDGRPAPSKLSTHSFGGFSTGKWIGNMLHVETTHLKAYYTLRPGVPASDQRTVTERWVRHGDLLTLIQEIKDPVYLTEPLVWSMTWARSDGPLPPSPEAFCHPSPELPSVASDKRRVPSWLPGTNPTTQEVMDNYGVPADVVRADDGAAMMYPEYRKRMKQTASSLDICKLHCNN